MRVALLLVTLALIVAVASALRVRKHPKLPITLSNSEISCLNRCPRGMMCPAVCLPDYKLQLLTDAEIAFPYPRRLTRRFAPVNYLSDSELKINKCDVCELAVKAIKKFGPKILNEKNKEKICAPLNNYSDLCQSLITKLVEVVHDKADPYKTCAFYKMCPRN